MGTDDHRAGHTDRAPADATSHAADADAATTVQPSPSRRGRLGAGFIAAGLIVVSVTAWISITIASAPASTARPSAATPATSAPARPSRLDCSARSAHPGAPTDSDQSTVDPPPAPASQPVLAGLPPATTYGTIVAAPLDTGSSTAPSGQVVHPATTVAVYAKPGCPAIAALPPQQAGNDTWLPVINQQADWAQVLLPARPNGATGWIYLNPATITEAITPYRIVIDRQTFTLTLLDNNVQVGQWSVGVGLPQSVTPVGRTFILASIKDPTQTFSPIILPLGIHSDTYADYSGGPGTIGIHGWPSGSVFDEQSSHGCIRVPPQALAVLSTQVPIGTPVLIS